MRKVSPTQISLWRECRRKYVYQYVAGLRQPPSAAQQFGLEGHALLERWLRHAEYPPETDIGLTARQGIRKGWLPTPSEALLVEVPLLVSMRDIGADLIGFADCIDVVIDGSVPPTIIDHKFTSSLRWAKTASELHDDPQALFYTRWARRYFGTDCAQARWIYYAGSKPNGAERPRKPAGAQRVELMLKHNPHTWDALRRDVADIVAVRDSKPAAKSQKPSPDACSSFGGCPFKGLCRKRPGKFFPSFDETPSGENEEIDMGLADKMKNKTVPINPPADGEKFRDELEEKLKNALSVEDSEPEEDAQENSEPEPEPEPEKQTAEKTVVKKRTRKRKTAVNHLIVLKGALPNKQADLLGNVYQLVDILAPLMQEVAHENDVAHWGLIEYAQGKSLLATKLDRLWAEARPTGTIVADSSAEAQAVQSVLAAYADVVIHGLRV